jgi:hypothetical protein
MLRPAQKPEASHTPLILAGLAFVFSLLLRQLPILGWIVYPFQLLVTMVHELSHGLAALLTGGRFINFTIDTNTSGLATTADGWRLFVIPAGYVGTALIGGLLLVLIHRSSDVRRRRWLAVGLGLFFALTTVLFARNLTAIAVGSVSALAMMILGVYGSPLLLLFGLNLIAIQIALNALDSLLGLMRLNAGPFQLPNDAQSMANLTHIPALFWAVLWSLAALAILVGSIYWAFQRGDNA